MTSTVDTRTPDATAASGSRRHGGVPTTLARRWPTGIGVAAVAASLTALAPLPDQVHAWISAWCVLLAAVIYLAWGTARGDLSDRRLLTAQTAAVLGFGAVAMAAVAVDPAAARYVLAAGWLAHAAWDVAHHRLGRVVPRWYAETCLAADLMIATALLTVGLV
ncbi:hypothetical protein [Blastococcus sp. VKM Ac-2987]|uniref:hypothetical protein n=1 Tax=Blastococcus sp. VKM Ac-2987 TaxID=3004141 RepID=UPI0022ABBAE1|nr:hypothetical protein [Blastococcus sp. VKM Ac-2987]MCZ2860814.1 hypothetical protein [Blastococcus sp. VKM Ac-2987]